jgi:hypothetical protein
MDCLGFVLLFWRMGEGTPALCLLYAVSSDICHKQQIPAVSVGPCHCREILAEGEEVIRVGKLYLVDLAGSENISRWGGERAGDRGLSALNNASQCGSPAGIVLALSKRLLT